MSETPTTTAPRVRPIPFTGEMVRAVLSGSKTQHREIAKWELRAPGLNLAFSGLSPSYYNTAAGAQSGWVLCSRGVGGCWEDRTYPLHSPYGVPGDRLWVAEDWCVTGHDLVTYRADGITRQVEHSECEHLWMTQNSSRWRSPRHMYRWASRLTLEITGVRVERLQDISEWDARAEGVATGCLYLGRCNSGSCPALDTTIDGIHRGALDDYRRLWESIHGPGSWAANPWLWVLEFKRVDASLTP